MSLRTLVSAIWNHPANRVHRLAAMRRFVFWQLRKRLTGRPMTIDYHGLKLTVHPDSHSSSKALYFNGLPDYREMRFIQDYLRPGDCFVDVGANIGLYTLLAASIVGPSGHVHAFEPGEIPASRLAADVARNRLTNVTIHRVAASDVDSSATLERTGDDCTARIGPLPAIIVAEHSDVRPHGASAAHTAGRTVSTVRLDRVLPDIPYAMFKLDIEGYEPNAIRGAEGLMRNGNPPVLQLEMAGYSKNYGVTTPQLIRQLDDLGYDCTYYDPDSKQLRPTDRPWTVPVEDVLAVYRASAAVVRNRLAQKVKTAPPGAA